MNLHPLFIGGNCVERLSDLRFLGFYIKKVLTWRVNTTTIIKKAQQRPHEIRILRISSLQQNCCSIESILAYRKENTSGGHHSLSNVSGISIRFLLPHKSSENPQGRVSPSQGHFPFELLPSGRRHRTLKSWTNRLRTIFMTDLSAIKHSEQYVVQVLRCGTSYVLLNF